MTAAVRRIDPTDLADLLPSWVISLKADRKSPQTVKTYLAGVTRFLGWCAGHDIVPALDRGTVSAFVADLLDEGAEATTARIRMTALKAFSRWLAAEGELPVDELVTSKGPRLDTKVVTPFTADQLHALIAACRGSELRDRRDEAIVRLMAETGARAGEVVAMARTDLDLTAGTVTVQRGKGGKGRTLPVGPQTARSIDRYLRLRRAHRLADTPALWLGGGGQSFTYPGLYGALRARAEAAGVDGFHPHRLRHTAASRWLTAGGSEGGAMAVFGWKRREMLDRYVQATASERAAAEARGLNLGDL